MLLLLLAVARLSRQHGEEFILGLVSQTGLFLVRLLLFCFILFNKVPGWDKDCDAEDGSGAFDVCMFTSLSPLQTHCL